MIKWEKPEKGKKGTNQGVPKRVNLNFCQKSSENLKIQISRTFLHFLLFFIKNW